VYSRVSSKALTKFALTTPLESPIFPLLDFFDIFTTPSFFKFFLQKQRMEASRDSAHGLFSPCAGDGLVSGITAIRLVVEHNAETEGENSRQNVFPPDSYAGSLLGVHIDKAMLRLAVLSWR
jgi:hypothetical protein